MTSESDDEYYPYSSGDDMDMSDDNSDCSEEGCCRLDNDDDDVLESALVARKSGIQMIGAKELRLEMDRIVTDVMEVLGVSMASAAVLLREYNWSKEALLDAYTKNMDAALKQAGVYFRCCGNNVSPSPTRTCEICYDEVDGKLSMPCGHGFCYDCWNVFCVNSVEEGPSCVTTTCPNAGCQEAVTEEEMKVALGESSPYLATFRNYQLRSFVDSNRLARWCPGRGCERIAYALSASAMESEGNVVHCDSCQIGFCMVCGEEPHQPASCKLLAKWNEKCRNESETANWILAKTKSCPKCAVRIEKNHGCNHMTCGQCRHEFCWLCRGTWIAECYGCNRYESTKDNDESDEARAERELERYLHYYGRYQTHGESQKFAEKQVAVRESNIAKGSAWSDFRFLNEANEQLVVCRRVLKYTYVVAFYIEDDTSPIATMRRERFEYHQAILERFTETLSGLSEKPMDQINRIDVINQTLLVDQFIKNVVKYVEDGMDEGIIAPIE